MVKEASGVAGLFLKSTAKLHGPYTLARTIKKNWSMEKNHAYSPLNINELSSRKIFNNKTGTMVGSFRFISVHVSVHFQFIYSSLYKNET